MIRTIKKSIPFKSIVALLEMSGILFGKITPIRLFLYLAIALEILAFTYIPYLSTYQFSIWYAVIWFIVRQTFLFSSFTPKGLAYRMKNKWGEQTAGEIYLHITAFSFWYRARSYSLLIKHTSWDLFPGLKAYFPTLFEIWGFDINALVLISYGCALIGMIINVWSFILIERGAYYYMDMFYGRFLTTFKKSGPYKWFENPMYGPGQIPSYGVALAAGSVSGIIMSFLNQVCAYIFYYGLEKPHIKRCIANGLVPEGEVGGSRH